MSKIIATVSDIQSCDSLHIVKFDFLGQTLAMMSLEIDKKIKIGTKVSLQIKPSHVALGKNIQGELSYSNQLNCKIKSIENGELLSSITLEFKNTTLESIITKGSVKRLGLKTNEEVTALIKASEISIGEVLDV